MKICPQLLKHISPRRPNPKYARGAFDTDQSPKLPKEKTEKIDSQVSTDKLKKQSQTLDDKENTTTARNE